MKPAAFGGHYLIKRVLRKTAHASVTLACTRLASSSTVLGGGAANVLQCQREASASGDESAERGESLTPII